MKLNVPMDRIAEFCERWKVQEFALFGSVLREDFRPDSDVDVLLAFRPEARISLFDYPAMQDDLEAIFERRVDVLSRRGVEESRNPFRKKAILESARTIYAAA
jgi:uncharacterized protein